MLIKELVYIVKRALGERMENIFYISDYDCLGQLFQHREETGTVCIIQETLNQENFAPLPLYHVDGEMNIVYLLMKEHTLSYQDVSKGSLWQREHDWMTGLVETMLIHKYDDIHIKTNKNVSFLLRLNYILTKSFCLSYKIDLS